MVKNKRKPKLIAALAETGCTQAAMRQSKTLAAMVVIGILVFSGLQAFLIPNSGYLVDCTR